MTLKDIAIDPLTHDLLKENGKLDCEQGVDRYTGWSDVCKLSGFTDDRRTPAQEAYLDGYFSGVFGSKKPT